MTVRSPSVSQTGRPNGRTPAAIRTVKTRRRPSGEPPPLPRHLHASGKWWLGLTAAVLLFWVVAGLTRRTAVHLDILDHRILVAIAELRSPGLTEVMRAAGSLATGPVLQGLWLINAIVLLVWRRWRHLFIWIGVTAILIGIGASINAMLERPRPMGIEILGDWRGFTMPSLPVMVLAMFLVSTLYSLVPAGRLRTIGKYIAAGLLLITIAARLYLAQDAPSDALAGLIIGIASPLAAFRLLVPNDVFPVTYRRGRSAHLDVSGARHDAIVQALNHQLGLVVISVKPFGLEGSGGSTPLRVKVKGDPDTYVFCKLYAATHLRSDRWFKLGRTLLYGRLEDEKAFNTVRRLVQYEDYILRVMYQAGLPVPRPYGIAEITPEREYLLVAEFFDGACEIGEAEVDEAIMDQGLSAVRQMWQAGLAHRDIKPANLLVRNGKLFVIDSAFAEFRPSPWRQAVDLGNMMLVLGLRSDAPRVYARAKKQFSDEEIAEAFAATRGLTMPTQLRHMLRSQGRDLHAEFTELLPYRLPPVKIQRWSMRRVGLIVVVVIVILITAAFAVQLLLQPPL